MKALYGQKLYSSVLTLIDGANLISDAKEKSEVFNEYFCSQSKIGDDSASIFKLMSAYWMSALPKLRCWIY